MNVQFFFFANLVALLLAGYTFILLVRSKIYIGYAVVWLALIFIVLATLNLPPLRSLLYWTTGTEDIQLALTLLILGGVAFILVYYSVQISILAKRINELTRHIALKESESSFPDPKSGANDSSSSDSPDEESA